jgi:hypothetical protein
MLSLWRGCLLCGLWLAGEEAHASAAEAAGGHAAASDGPLVVLFCEHGADQAHDRSPVGEDPDDVDAAAGLLVLSGRYGRAVLRQPRRNEDRKGPPH